MTDESGLTADELVIAVYLDTNVLLDLLATLEDGFSLVERITSGQTVGNMAERGGNAEFGIPNIFQFFKFGFSGKLGKSTSEGSSATTEAERTHTYGSLLHRLRKYLIDEAFIATVPTDVGAFIEFKGVVRPNPFTDSFVRLQRMLRFADVALEIGSQSTSASSGSKQNRGRPQNQPSPAYSEAKKMKAILDFVEQLTKDVEREGTTTIVLTRRLTVTQLPPGAPA